MTRLILFTGALLCIFLAWEAFGSVIFWLTVFALPVLAVYGLFVLTRPLAPKEKIWLSDKVFDRLENTSEVPPPQRSRSSARKDRLSA
jgi:hypothetical protein